MNRIKELRLAHGWLQSDLAQKLHTGKHTISRYETGDRCPDLETVMLLCDIFGCTADYLLGRTSARLPALTDEQDELVRTYEALPLAIRQAVDGLMAPYRAGSEQKKAL